MIKFVNNEADVKAIFWMDIDDDTIEDAYDAAWVYDVNEPIYTEEDRKKYSGAYEKMFGIKLYRYGDQILVVFEDKTWALFFEHTDSEGLKIGHIASSPALPCNWDNIARVYITIFNNFKLIRL